MVKIRDKTKKQPIKELAQLRRRIAELEASGRKRNQFEEALRTERDKAQQYLDVAEVILVALNKKGEITLINRKGNQILGYKEGELLGKNWFTTCVPSPRRKKVKSRFLELMAGAIKLTEFYENPALTQAGTERIIAWHNTLLKDEYDAPIGTLSSGMDITERKQAEQRYQTILRIAMDGFGLVDMQGHYQDVNEAYCRIIGYSRNELLNMTIPDIEVIESSEDTAKHIRKIEKIGYDRFETRQRRKDGKIIDVEVSVTYLPTDGGRMVAFYRDITERKQAEEALRESETTLRALITAPTDSVLLLDSQGIILDLNKIAAKRLGKKRDELIGTLADSSLPEDVAKRRRSIISQILKTGREVRFEDERDGIWFDTVAHPITDKDGAVGRIAIIARDITERKRADEELRQSEERYRLLFEEARDGIALADADTGILLDCNQALADLVGRNRAELIGQHQAILHPPSGNNTGISATFKKHLTNKEGQVLETQVLTVTGEIREVEIKANLLYLHGRKMLQGIFRDITERKRAEETLRKSEDKYRTILKNIEEGYYEVDLAGNFTFFNDSMCRILRYPKEEMMGMNNRQFTDKEYAKKLFKTFNEVYRTGEPAKEFDWQIIRKDGTKRYIEVSVSLQKNSSGKPIGFRGISRDITERKQAEEALRKSEEKYRSIIENMQEGYFENDLAGNFTFVNDALCRLIGYPREELIGKNNRQYTDEKTAKKIYQVYNKIYRTGEPSKGIEEEYIRKDGIKGFTELSVSLISDVEGKPIGFRGISLNITERKQAEEALRESEQRYRGLFEGTAEGILIADLKSKQFLYANPSICNMLGYSEEELRNLSVRDIHPSESLEHVISEFEAQARGKKLLAPAIPCLRKNGTIMYADIVTSKILIDNKECNAGFFTDVTERKLAEEALRESETRFRTLFEAIPDTVVVYDDEGTILHMNEVGAQQLEWSTKDLVGRNLREIVTPENAASIADHIRETHKIGWSRFETTYVSRSGWQIVAEVNEHPIKFRREKAILSVARDITERKKAEDALLREKKFSDAVINSSPGLLFVIGDKGNTIQWNKNVEIVTGYSAGEIAKMNIIDFVAKEDKKTAAEAIQEALTKGQASLEINLLSKPGKKIPFYITGRSTKIENAICVVCTGLDIIERKQAEEEVKRSYDQLHETLISTVNAMTSTVEMRDPYTAGHQRRATQLACAIAGEMGLPAEQIEGIRMAGLIHDIGKIIVPAEILSKPGPLTEVQYGMVKMHPQAGYDILKGIKFPWPVAEIVFQHHERMDGSGYPHGVKGEEIMLEARILAVADVVEAMASHRPYRPSLGIDKALEEISQNRGVLYDPDVVDACARLFAEKGFKLE